MSLKRNKVFLAGIVCTLLISCNNIFHLIASSGEEESNGEYIVRFDKNGGDTEADPQAMIAQAPTFGVMLPQVEPKRDGYIFTAWNTNEDGSGTEFTRGTPVNGNITVYAQWLYIPSGSFIVRFDKKNADAGSQEAHPQNKAVISPNTTIGKLPLEPIRTGYDFTCWDTRDDGSGTAFDENTAVTESITVYAQWDPYKCVVTFDSNHDDADGFTEAAPAEKTVIYPATTVDALPTTPPTREGYNFIGWNTRADGKGTAFTEKTPVGILYYKAITVFAQWAEKTYTISGKIILSDDGDASGAEVILFREGIVVARVSANADGTYTFTDVLSRPGYTVRVSLRRYIADPSPSFDVERADKNAPDLILTRLWVISGTVLDEGNNEPISDAQIVLKENGAPVEYAYTLGNGYYELDASTGTYSIAVSCLSYVPREETIIVSADVEKNFKLELITFAVSGKITLEGGSGNLRDVNLRLVGNGTYETSPQADGNYSFPAVREGSYIIYATLTNYRGEQESFSVTGANVTNKNLTLKRQWTITFDSKGGGTLPSQPVAHGEMAIRPTDPIYPGFALENWYRDTEPITAYNFPTTPVTGDLTLFAKWNPIQYTVRFNAYGGDGTMADQSFTYGVSQNLRSNTFTNSGYTFAGWATTAGGAVVYTNGQSVNNLATTQGEVFTLYAKWNETYVPPTPVTVNGTVVLDGGTGLRQNVLVQLFTIDVVSRELIPIGSPVKPNSSGMFSIPDVTETIYIIVASLDGYVTAVESVTPSTPFSGMLTLVPGISGTSQGINLQQLLLQLNN